MLDRENLIENVNDTVFDYEPVLSEIEKQTSGRKSWVKNLLILCISLIVFFNLGLLESGLTDLLIIILVLFIHEAGHFIGMRLFGYRNVQMFFIPLFGAAVKGEGLNVSGYKKAIVTLLGPVPGVIAGFVFVIVYAATGIEIYFKLALMFTLINAFNLLPFFPLDGGRFLNEVLFSRNRYIELFFNVIASAALIGCGYLLKSWILGVFGLVSLVAVQTRFKVAGIAINLKQDHSQLDTVDTQEIRDETETVDAEVIPRRIAVRIIDQIRQNISAKLKAPAAASYTRSIWERIRARPPGASATVGLLGLYLFSFCFALVPIAGTVALSIYSDGIGYESKLVEYQQPGGQMGRKEQIYFAGKLFQETDVEPNTSLYHGRDVAYYPDGSIAREGTWYQGRQHGQWKEYDPNEVLTAITVFDNGRFVARREKQADGRWIEKSIDDLSLSLRQTYQQLANCPPRGPGSLPQELTTIEAEPIITE